MRKWWVATLLLTSTLAYPWGFPFSFWGSSRFTGNVVYFCADMASTGGSEVWDDPNNWFLDAGCSFSKWYGKIPQAHDYVVIKAADNGPYTTGPSVPISVTGFVGNDVPSGTTNNITISYIGSITPRGILDMTGSGSWDGSNELGAVVTQFDFSNLNSTWTGNMAVTGASNIYGTVTGNLTLDSSILQSTGEVKGNIIAVSTDAAAEIKGLVDGNATLSNAYIDSSGVVVGDAVLNGGSDNAGGISGHLDAHGTSTNGVAGVGNYGTADFWDSSQNLDCTGLYTQGTTVMHDSSFNATALNSVSFYDSSTNSGGCGSLQSPYFTDFSVNNGGTNTPTFDGHSTCAGWSNDNAYFTASATLTGYVVGHCTFDTNAVNNGDCQGGADFSNSSSQGGTTEGGINAYDTAVIGGTTDTGVFNGSSQQIGTLTNGGVFNNVSQQNGTSNGYTQLFDSGVNSGNVNAQLDVYNSAINTGTVVGDSYYNNTASQQGSIIGNAFFANSSTMDAGTVSLNCDFIDDSSHNGGTCSTYSCSTTGNCP